VRDFLLKTALILLLALLAGFAWLTRHPDAEILERATDWPWVGEWARSFREAYLPPEAPEELDAESSGDEGPEIVYVDAPGLAAEAPDDLLGARPIVWVEDGTPLLAEPEEGADVIERTDGIANLRVFERRGDWFDVRYRRTRGWVYLEDYEESDEPPLGSEPLPPGPLEARAPDPERVQFARALLGAGEVTIEVGPYAGYTDARRPELEALLDRVLRRLEAVYLDRYGLDPVGEPGGVLVLFGDPDDFARYSDRELGIPGLTAAGVASSGIVAIVVGQRRDDEIAATAVHEVTHLLNRRSLGPALPAWLEEGLADDLAQSEIDPDGTLVTERLGGVSLRRFDGWEWRGALASALALREAVDQGRLRPLAELTALDWREFVSEEPERPNYAQASFWLRFLLEDPELSVGLRAYLAGVAAGASAEGEELRRHLGRSWERLDADFERWIRLRFHDPR
jgi:hypothetical protein